jgi:hypothetical protein
VFPLARRWRKGANAAHCPYLCWCINRPLRSLLETLNTLNVGLVAMPWLAPMAATPCCTGFPYRKLRRSSTTRCILSRSRGEDLLGRMAEGRKLVSDFAGLLKLLTARFKEARRSHRCSSLRPFCSYQHEAADALHSGYLARPGIAAADALHYGHLARTSTGAADVPAVYQHRSR